MIQSFSNFVKRYQTGIIAACIVGVLVGAPTVLSMLQAGGEYHGVQFISDNDENTYRARIQEILDGHLLVASPNLYEHKDAAGVVPPIFEYFYALPAAVFGLSFTIAFSKFVFPALICFLSYLIVIQIISMKKEEHGFDHELTAVLAGLLAIFGLDALHIGQLFAILSGHGDAFYQLTWLRLVNPIIGGMLLFIFLLAFLQVHKRAGRVAVLVSGIVLGLSVGYIFSFGMIASILFAYTLLALVMWDRERLLRSLSIFAIGMVISLPYWIIAFGSIGGAEGKLLAARNGMYFTHEPIVNKFVLFVSITALITFCIQYRTKRYQEYRLVWMFLASLILASWIVFNQQIITGRSIWYHHFAQYTAPLGFLVLLVIGYLFWRKRSPRVYRFLLVAILVISTATLTAIAFTYKHGMKGFIASQQHAELLHYLNTLPSKRCVVLVKEDRDAVEQMIPAYTKCDVYSTTYTFNGVPSERIVHSFLLRMRLAGVSVENARTYLENNEANVRNYFFENWDQAFGRGLDSWALGKIDFLAATYKDFLLGDLNQQLRAYKIDYLVSREPLSEQLIRTISGITFATSTSEYYIYRVDGGEEP